jgi:hypothetical protein
MKWTSTDFYEKDMPGFINCSLTLKIITPSWSGNGLVYWFYTYVFKYKYKLKYRIKHYENY